MREKDKETRGRYEALFAKTYQELAQLINPKAAKRMYDSHCIFMMIELETREAEMLRELRDKVKDKEAIEQYAKDNNIEL